MRVRGLTAVALWLALSGVAGAKLGGDTFTLGPWSGEAIADAQGNFVACMMSASYPSGDELVLSMIRTRQFNLSVQHDAWQLTNGGAYNANVVIDGKRYATTGNAISEHQFAVFVPIPSPLVHALRDAKRLTVEIDGHGKAVYPMEMAFPAMGRLLMCMRFEFAFAGEPMWPSSYLGGSDGGAASTPAPPRATASQAPGEPAAPRGRARESTSGGEAPALSSSDLTVLAVNLFSEAGLSGFHLLNKAERKAAHIDQVAVAWMVGDTVGALDGYDLHGGAAAQQAVLGKVASNIVAVDAVACQTKFASGFKDETSSTELTLKRIFTACDDAGDNSWHYEYLLAMTRDHKLLKFWTTAGDPGATRGHLTSRSGATDLIDLIVPALRAHYAKPEETLH